MNLAQIAAARLGRWRALVALLALTLVTAAALGATGAATASAATAKPAAPLAPPPGKRALLVLIAPPTPASPTAPLTSLFSELEHRRELSLGMVNATQGSFNRLQALLDMTQGTRVSYVTYRPTDVPPLSVVPRDGDATVAGWQSALDRASAAPAKIEPGLLAGSVPGGAAWVGLSGQDDTEAIVAANRSGEIAGYSAGSIASLPARASDALARHSLVVVSLPGDPQARTALDALLKARSTDELMLVVQSPPPGSTSPQLLRAGVAGLSNEPGTLSSATTRQRGIVAGIDILPTILDHLGVRVPHAVAGQPIQVEPGRDSVASLEAYSKRLRVIGPRRVPAIQGFLLLWGALMLALGLVADRRGLVAARRIGALAILWMPAMLLVTAVLQPNRTVEVLVIAIGALVLAAVTDRVLPWPRGPALPAAVTLIAYAALLAAGSPLIGESLLGPNPRSGSRFFGLGNELAAAFSALWLIGLGSVLPAGGRSRRLAAIVAALGGAVAVVVGAGRLGANVGGMLTVVTGAAVATVLMLPGRLSPRTVALALLAIPVLGLGGLTALDLVTGGNGHFTREFLHAGGGGDVLTIFSRKLQLAANNLRNMALLTIVCLLAAAYAIRYRDRLYTPLHRSPAWTAALYGAFASGVVGSLVNDSGPLLLLVVTVALGAATAYVRGVPADRTGAHEQPSDVPNGTHAASQAALAAERPPQAR